MPTIKVKKEMNLPRLIEWLWKSKKSVYKVTSNMNGVVKLEPYGLITFSSGDFYPEETFTVEVEEEITEDTEIPRLLTTFKKMYLKHDFGYQRVRIDEGYKIQLMLNKAEAHGEEIETLHMVNDDGTHTLIWTKEEGLVE